MKIVKSMFLKFIPYLVAVLINPLAFAADPSEKTISPVCYADYRCGYVDGRGRYVIAPNYSYAFEFSKSGLAVVARDGKRGCINRRGEEIIKIKWDYVNCKNTDLVWVENGEKQGVVNINGAEIIPIIYQSIYMPEVSEGLIPVKNNGRWGYFNSQGKQVIPFQYSDVNLFNNSLASVCKSEKCGYINSRGEEVIKLKYDKAYDFNSSGLAAVYLNGTWQFIDKQGNVIISTEYDFVDPYNYTLKIVGKNDKFGFVNSKGLEIVALKYDVVHVYDYGAIVCINKPRFLCGLTDTNGREVVDLKYSDDIGFTKNGLTRIMLNEKYGYLNSKGQEVIKVQFDKANHFLDNGLAIVVHNRKVRLIDDKGRFLTAFDNFVLNDKLAQERVENQRRKEEQLRQETSRQASSPPSSGGVKLFYKNDSGSGWGAICNNGELRFIQPGTIGINICGYDGNRSECRSDWTPMDAANWSCR